MRFALATVERWNLGLSASAVAASLALETPHFATSLAAGALLEALNLGALRRAALRFFDGEMTRSWTGAFALRFLLLAAGIFLTLRAGANPVALLIGLSIAMPAVLIDAWLNRPPILDPATLPVLLDDEEDEEREEAARAARRDEGLALTGPLMRFLPGSLTGRLVSPRALSPDEALSASDCAGSEADPETRTTEAAPAADETRR
jgi:hypothetical protein